MSILILTLITIAFYKLSTFQDKTDKQKHNEYLTELIKLKKLKNLNN